jgi:DNA-binding response OmpR family regulator
MSANVLFVEDDLTIGRVLASTLSTAGHQTRWVTTGAEALAAAVAGSVDLVLLDLGLPDMDGIEICGRLREVLPEAVLVVLTARSAEIDVVLGLEAGADDYLTKPFRLAELLARIHAHLRRGSPNHMSRIGRSSVRVGALEIDPAARRVHLGPAELSLRAKEFDLLARFMEEPGDAISRATLMSDVWDEHWFGSTKTLDVHVAALRRKLDRAAAETSCPTPAIVTVRAHGFRLEPPCPRSDGAGSTPARGTVPME